MYLCTFTLAVSGGAVLLLPFSIISREILLSLPKNYYIQWLNESLIHGKYELFPLVFTCVVVNLWSCLTFPNCSFVKFGKSTGSLSILLCFNTNEIVMLFFQKTNSVLFSIFLVMATRWCQCLSFLQVGFWCIYLIA